MPVEEGVQAVVDPFLDRVRLADELLLARAAEQLDGGLEPARGDGVGDGDGGGGATRSEGVVGVAVPGAVGRAVGVVVVDQRIV